MSSLEIRWKTALVFFPRGRRYLASDQTDLQPHSPQAPPICPMSPCERQRVFSVRKHKHLQDLLHRFTHKNPNVLSRPQTQHRKQAFTSPRNGSGVCLEAKGRAGGREGRKERGGEGWPKHPRVNNKGWTSKNRDSCASGHRLTSSPGPSAALTVTRDAGRTRCQRTVHGLWQSLLHYRKANRRRTRSENNT